MQGSTSIAATAAVLGCAVGVGVAVVVLRWQNSGNSKSEAQPAASTEPAAPAAAPAAPPTPTAKPFAAAEEPTDVLTLSPNEKALVEKLVEAYVDNWHAANNEAVDIGQFKLPLGLGTIDLFPDDIEKHMFKRIWSCVVFNMLEMSVTVGGVKMRMHPIAALDPAFRGDSAAERAAAHAERVQAATAERLAKNETLLADLSKQVSDLTGALLQEQKARERASALEAEATQAAAEMAHELATLRATAADPHDGLATALQAEPAATPPRGNRSSQAPPRFGGNRSVSAPVLPDLPRVPSNESVTEMVSRVENTPTPAPPQDEPSASPKPG